MFKEERQAEIMSILGNETYASIEYIAKKLHASQSSIRRDVTLLARKGLLKRSYGGVELGEGAAASFLPFSAHKGKNVKEKRQIAAAAAELVSDGDTVFLDGSSTCYYLAEALSEKKNLTVITNNSDSVSYLSQFEGIAVYSTGGLASPKNRGVLTGPVAEMSVRQMHADIFFMSPIALSEKGEVSDDSAEENMLRRIMLENSSKRVVMFDKSKLGKSSAFIFGRLSDFDFAVFDSPSEALSKAESPDTEFLFPNK